MIKIIKKMLNKFKPNCTICIFRVIDGDFEVLLTPGKMTLDNYTSSVRLISQHYNVDETAIPYRFFKQHKGSRMIFLYSPSPSEFRPVEYEFMLDIKGKAVKRAYGDTDCLYCEYEEKNKENPKLKFEDHIKSKKEVFLCARHLNKFSKARFKVISDDRKELYGTKIQERMRRALNKKESLWDKPWFQLTLILVGAAILFAVIIKYGGDYQKDMFMTMVEEYKKVMYDMPVK